MLCTSCTIIHSVIVPKSISIVKMFMVTVIWSVHVSNPSYLLWADLGAEVSCTTFSTTISENVYGYSNLVCACEQS